tara:strand:+ start:535 stop:651 length:117 start_codon:yes stop_codon:yes gene_type:complete
MWCLEVIVALNEKAQREYEKKKRAEKPKKTKPKVAKVA